MPGRSSQWLLPLIRGGSRSSASTICGVGFAWAGVPHKLFFQGASKVALSRWRRGCCPQPRKLPASTNHPTSKQADVGFAQELFPPECVRDLQTWLKQTRNTRQGDRQKTRKKNADQGFHTRPHDAGLFVRAEPQWNTRRWRLYLNKYMQIQPSLSCTFD